jgi:hypothetical protein
MLSPRLSKKHRKSSRRGGAVVELAIVMPVLIMIIFGAIEASNLLYLQQAITETAYDGALRASRPGATDAAVKNELVTLLEARGITADSIEIGDSVNTIENVPSGHLFKVLIRADTASHLVSPKVFANFSKIEVHVVARKQ